jgi:hypothetical protein
MGTPFSDITLYLPTSHTVGTSEYNEEVSLLNFVSDLYVQKMNGYKPPKTSRITINPAYHDTWNRTWKTGSIVALRHILAMKNILGWTKKAGTNIFSS